MEHQRDIHEESWDSRKPDRGTVMQKPRIKTTVSLLDNIVDDGDRVFDLGCGDGTMGLLLKEIRSVSIDGCDISKTAVNRAQDHYDDVHQINIDENDLPVNSDAYDVVICTDVLEHTLSPRHALSEIQRILKNEGIVVVSVPNFGFIRYRFNSIMGDIPRILRDERHYSTFTRRSLQNILEKEDFQIRSVTGVSRLKRMADIHPDLFGKTIIITAKIESE